MLDASVAGARNAPSVVDFVTSVYNPGDRVYLVGHSAGGNVIFDVAYQLRNKKIPVQMTAQIDSVRLFRGRVSDNVTRAFNFYHPFHFGDRCPVALLVEGNIVSTRKNGIDLTVVTNTPIEDPAGPEVDTFCSSHKNMDNDPRVWRPILQFMGGGLP